MACTQREWIVSLHFFRDALAFCYLRHELLRHSFSGLVGFLQMSVERACRQHGIVNRLLVTSEELSPALTPDADARGFRRNQVGDEAAFPMSSCQHCTGAPKRCRMCKHKKSPSAKCGGRCASEIQIHLEVLPAMDTTPRGILVEITICIILRDREGRNSDEAIFVTR